MQYIEAPSEVQQEHPTSLFLAGGITDDQNIPSCRDKGAGEKPFCKAGTTEAAILPQGLLLSRKAVRVQELNNLAPELL